LVELFKGVYRFLFIERHGQSAILGYTKGLINEYYNNIKTSERNFVSTKHLKMEKKLQNDFDLSLSFQSSGSAADTEKLGGIKKINYSGDQFTITEALPGVYCGGVQYYDLKDINFINNTGMADLIDLLRSLLKKGVEVQFVNVNEKIKSRIASMGLDHIINCSEMQKIEKAILL
jgi:ABC-type transporter Mla MlaB component